MGPEITLALLPCQVFFLRPSVFSVLTHRIPSFSWLFLPGTSCAKSDGVKPLHRFRELAFRVHSDNVCKSGTNQLNRTVTMLPSDFHNNEDLEWGAAETHRLRSIVVTF